MALRDQPYLPLYVQDFLTDENLAECSAESTGVYIRLMCIMHKSKEYGKILLRQKEQQSERQLLNFAEKLSLHMPYKVSVIESALDELLDHEVLYIDGNALCQKRMVKDAELSEKRSFAGKKGAESSNKRFQKNGGFATAKGTTKGTAKIAANTEGEGGSEYEIEIEGLEGITPYGKVMCFYMDKFNPTPSSLISGLLQDYTDALGADVVLHAMQIALGERKFGWNYLNAILKRYKSDGLNTMEKVVQSEQSFQAERKQKSDGSGRRRAKAPGEYKGDDFIAELMEGK